MPYTRSGKCVYKKNADNTRGKKKGCSDSEEEAKKYMKKLYSLDETDLDESDPMALGGGGLGDEEGEPMGEQILRSWVREMLAEGSNLSKSEMMNKGPVRWGIFKTRMDNPSFDESADPPRGYFQLTDKTKITIPKSFDADKRAAAGMPPGFPELDDKGNRIPDTQRDHNQELYDAVTNNDAESYEAAFRVSRKAGKPAFGGVIVNVEGSTTPRLVTATTHLRKDEHGMGGGGGPQAMGTKYEGDAADYFKSIMRRAVTPELQSTAAGAGDDVSDNEYWIGTAADRDLPGTKILKLEVKTSTGATYGQAQWRFTVDKSTGYPNRFYYQKGAKAGKLLDDLNSPIKKELNDPTKLANLRQEIQEIEERNGGTPAGASWPTSAWGSQYVTAKQGRGTKAPKKNIIVQGFTAVGPTPSNTEKFNAGDGPPIRDEISQKIYKYMSNAFATVRADVAKKVGNAGYTYYKEKGDHFIIVGSRGIYSLDQPSTAELAEVLDIPGFQEIGETKIGLRSPVGRLMNMPAVGFFKDPEGKLRGAPFPPDENALQTAVSNPNSVDPQLLRIAVGFGLWVSGLLEGLMHEGEVSMTQRIDDAVEFLKTPSGTPPEWLAPALRDDLDQGWRGSEVPIVDHRLRKYAKSQMRLMETRYYAKSQLGLLKERLIIEELTGADRSEIKRMIKKEIEGTTNKREIEKAFQKKFDTELKKALGTSFLGTPGKINKFVIDQIYDEVNKWLADTATRNEIAEITKQVLTKLYRELSFSSPTIIKRIKV